MAESTSTRHVPFLSASAPKNGWPRPHIRFWIAMARPKSERDQPVSASIGSWKKPIAERGPKVSAAIRQPLAMMSQGNPGSLFETAAVLIRVSFFDEADN
jgi:hypothetical protein